MADNQDQFTDGDTAGNSADLRAELARAKAEARTQQERLERDLRLARNALPTQRDPSTVAQNIAVQQQTQALRSTLREKDRLIEQLTKQCRGLEDQLEDHFQELDALRLQVEERELVLAEARRRPGSPPAPASESQPESPWADSAESSSRAAPDWASTPDGADLAQLILGAGEAKPPPIQPQRKSGGALAFFIGLLVGLLIAAGIGGGLWWSGHWPPARPPAVSQPSFLSWLSSLLPTGAKTEPTAVEPELASPSEGDQAASAVDAEPEPEPEIAPVRGVARDANGPEMIALNPGRFRMGNPTGMTSGDNRPARDVTLPSFMVGAREVTFAEYDRFVSATGARRPKDYGFGRGRQPVVDVTWDEAVAYTRWLSRRTGKPYRLPTEAEWEYAARAGTRSMFWWGYDKLAGGAVCLDCDTRQVPRAPAPVGASGPNPFGLYDTAGNVYEWVADCYRPSYTGAPTDGSAVTEISCRQRVARGGSFKTPASSARVDARRAFEPDTHINMLGFRVARDAR